ncbi:MAG: hypothetical protein E7582_07500 [Ruminococcaceae bacterium]|nr:hypothetical protein [Oscillospiraceae bacterium]
MLKVVNINLPLDYTKEYIKKVITERLKVCDDEVKNVILDKREIIKETPLYFKETFLVELNEEKEKKLALTMRKKGVSLFEEKPFTVPKSRLEKRPVVIGFGPAGIFSALVLAESGACPIILERGPETEKRMALVREFSESGKLNPEGNIQFGEGGAGAFSDGKLKVGYKDGIKRKILQDFVDAGASDTILYLEKPHVGSDVLHKVIVNLRQKIISLGGEVHFDSKVKDIDIKNGEVCGVIYEKNGKDFKIDCDRVILATGHSARDTYGLLYEKGIEMEAKGFGVGVRIEHKQEVIDEIEFGDKEYAKILGAADYKMVTHLKNSRSLYTFCMCPGGYVVPAASEEGGICTNGMSEFLRDGENANTALLVSVTPDDFPSSHPLAGIDYQREIEKKAFEVAGGDYSAPVIRLEDFMEERESCAFGKVLPTYRPNTKFVSPDKYLPHYVVESLREGLKDMCEYKAGYYCPDAIITGPETRTTSPVRIKRDTKGECPKVRGLFPVGEGAGYAGGIISSAFDAIVVTLEVLNEEN